MIRHLDLSLRVSFALALVVACGSPEERSFPQSEAPHEVQSGPAPGPSANATPGPATTPTAPPTTTPPPVTTPDAGAPNPNPNPNPQSFDMHTWKPDAKGLWIWNWDYIGMQAPAAAQKAQDLGVAYVLIKSGQDGSFWTSRFNAANLAEFQSRGIRVLAWPYITPSGGQAAIDAAVQAAQTPGCDGLVLDVEIEWEGDGTTNAKTLCQGIRAGAPGVFLGYTSFGWVGLHGTFPFPTFDQYCGDAYFPQIYFADRGVAWNNSTKGLAAALQQYATAGLNAPLWPVTSNDDVYGTSAGPDTASLNAFFGAAGDYTSLWTFPDKTRPEKLTQLGSLAWPN